MSEGNESPVRRQYVKRKDEFLDIAPEVLRARVNTEIALQATLRAGLKNDPENAEAKRQLKDSVNFNVRAYKRLRMLGFPCKAKKEMEVKVESGS